MGSTSFRFVEREVPRDRRGHPAMVARRGEGDVRPPAGREPDGEGGRHDGEQAGEAQERDGEEAEARTGHASSSSAAKRLAPQASEQWRGPWMPLVSWFCAAPASDSTVTSRPPRSRRAARLRVASSSCSAQPPIRLSQSASARSVIGRGPDTSAGRIATLYRKRCRRAPGGTGPNARFDAGDGAVDGAAIWSSVGAFEGGAVVVVQVMSQLVVGQRVHEPTERYQTTEQPPQPFRVPGQGEEAAEVAHGAS